ncbi:RagB/SusD family nutrient uptake outer membrane protein [Flavobacterium sp. MC2016-06]|uniref:RagB/SusD family nutrient uptake outer membrane protein n=1 Tax=Flavobacterium sp. MC2016-06 TaxID=2676308 RepID=UPI0012BA7B12|nr:RagB/SusD family nutrient uptake outer membrane protein [Flavobacterium sp. MC2016-06]MBU3860319.1 RagB/SusD family nutrient uptake outer membrane protein [Flavobacterium sp. MC2016-06]
MKNQNRVYKILISGLLLLGTGCTNLDETVYDKITAEGTVLTEEDLTSIVAPAYTSFRTIFWGWDGLHDLYEESSDLLVTPQRNGIGWGDYYITMHQHTWGSALPHAEGNWSYMYTGVNSVNRAIYQIEQIDGIANKDKVIQELKALRAIYYYLLLDNFRNVPIVTTFINPPGYLPAQNTGKEVYDFVESELKTALPYLSDENSSASYGKVTTWTVKMTLAKLYLNSAVYIGTPKWDEALAQVNDIISSGKFSLMSNYSDNFKIKNEGSTEEIFSIPFDQIKTGGSYWPFKSLAAPSQATFEMSGGPWNGTGGIPQFIDTYDPDDQRLKDCWLGGKQYTSKGEPIMVDGVQFEYINYMTNVNGCEPNEGYRLVKYEIGTGDIGQTSNDVPFYRYTDALMIKAECLLRTGDAEGAAAIVSQIRQRDFKNTNPSKATVTGAKLTGGSVYKYGTYDSGVITKLEGGADIQYGGFLDELAWEFIGEAHRKQDLIRFGVYTKKSWFSHTPNGDFKSIFPIPQAIMNTNSNLKQNPGYN